MSSPALVRQSGREPGRRSTEIEDQTGAGSQRAAPPPAAFGTIAGRWYRLNKDRMQGALIGALSLLAFLLAWYLLTKYRVVFFVRFTNVPSPLDSL